MHMQLFFFWVLRYSKLDRDNSQLEVRALPNLDPEKPSKGQLCNMEPNIPWRMPIVTTRKLLDIQKTECISVPEPSRNWGKHGQPMCEKRPP
jgi:hypothetical protein